MESYRAPPKETLAFIMRKEFKGITSEVVFLGKVFSEISLNLSSPTSQGKTFGAVIVECSRRYRSQNEILRIERCAESEKVSFQSNSAFLRRMGEIATNKYRGKDDGHFLCSLSFCFEWDCNAHFMNSFEKILTD